MIREKYTIESLKSFAQKKQGACLSDTYKTNKQKYKWQCELGHSWEATWMDVKAGHWCPTCKGIKNSVAKAKYSLEDLTKHALMKEGKCHSTQYKGFFKKHDWECIKGHKWSAKWSDVFHKDSWCPDCPHSSSRDEIAIGNFIETLGFSIRTSKLPSRKHLDIFVEEKNLAIEYCGIYWHTEESGKLRNYHNQKRLDCEKLGIRLITIFSDEWENRELQVKNFLKSVLGISTKIFARKCLIEEITASTARGFYEANHIQGGKVSIEVAFGLKFENELVGVVSGAKHHRGSEGLILNRLAFKDGIQVVGGASKLLKSLINYAKQQGYSKIVSWSDNRWSQGGVYRSVGFQLEKELPPDYSYVNLKKSDRRLPKQAHTKSSLLKKGATGTTEFEMAKSIGLTRIWDCGKKRWVLNLV